MNQKPVPSTVVRIPVKTGHGLVVVFLKNPVPGRVKTRLAPCIGLNAAADLYACCVADILSMLVAGGFTMQIVYDPPDAEDAIRRRLGMDVPVAAQRGRDLGERMANAFQAAFERNFERVVLIGSDLPHLTSRILETAFAALVRHDVVIGPALDGGYYLIGFRGQGFRRSVFLGVDWSTPLVLDQTRTHLRRLNLSATLLPEMQDLDTPEDLLLFMSTSHAPGIAAATRACLRAMFPEQDAARRGPGV